LDWDSGQLTTDRISRLEGAYEQVDKRLDDLQQSMVSLRGDVSTRLTSTEAQVIALRNEMNIRFESLEGLVNSRFNQLLILVGGSWITIMAGMLAIFFGKS
jgi:predicted  nucleic acid-binding Zn-ribbon protein